MRLRLIYGACGRVRGVTDVEKMARTLHSEAWAEYDMCKAMGRDKMSSNGEWAWLRSLEKAQDFYSEEK
jgi:hypothetical protein